MCKTATFINDFNIFEDLKIESLALHVIIKMQINEGLSYSIQVFDPSLSILIFIYMDLIPLNLIIFQPNLIV